VPRASKQGKAESRKKKKKKKKKKKGGWYGKKKARVSFSVQSVNSNKKAPLAS